MLSYLSSNCSTLSLSISICIWAWPGSRHRCLVYALWHYLAVRSYFCHVEFQISIMRLGNASLTIPAALTVLAICDRSKDGRARDGRRYNHNITAVVTNITQQHRITIIFTSNDGAHCLSMLMMTSNSKWHLSSISKSSWLLSEQAPPHL